MAIDVPIVDAHHHLAKLEIGYPWLVPQARSDRYHGDDRALRRDYLLEHYRSDMASLPLVASVHVENGAANSLDETRWLDSVISGHSPIPSAHVAYVDLGAANAAELIDTLAEMPHVRGVRHILNWHRDPRYTHTSRPGIMNEKLWRESFARLAPRGLSFDLQVFPEQLADAARLAGEYSETTIMLDHIGMPLARDADYLRSWSSGLRDVARQENVAAKISAIGTTDHAWSAPSIRPLVLEAIDAFGPERVMFGTNFPVDGLYSTASELFHSFDEITAGFTVAERASMFGRTANRLYRLKVPGLE